MPNGLAGSAQVSYPLLAPSGTVGAPTYSFAADSTTGFFRTAAVMGLAVQGACEYLFGKATTLGFILGSTITLGWSPVAANAAAPDVVLARDAADTLAQRRAANAQSFRVYETYTDASNYRMLNIGGNGFTLQSAGTGVSGGSLYLWNSQAGALEFATTNTRRWVIEATGSFVPYADNTYDIGSATNQARDIYAARYVFSGYFVASGAGAYLFNGRGGLRSSADGVLRLSNDADSSFTRLCFGGTAVTDPSIKRDGANLALVHADGSAGYIDLTVHDLISNSVYLSSIVAVGANNTNIALGGSGITAGLVNSAASFIIQVTGGAVLATFAGTGYLEMTEVTAPSAPAANSGRLYFEDNGAGKTRLMCLFGSGSAQQLAIEP